MGLRASKGMIQVRRDRLDRAMTTDSERKKREDKQNRLAREYPEMRRVVDFFFENCPCELSDDEKNIIEKELFGRQCSKSKLGVINFLGNIVGVNRWPDWVDVAKKEFGINY
ncbi:MAG: hypothetical protein IKK43_00295 [Clostridia bacterium]|nr:hypothetical protein [Clostridia bacterium]